MTGQLAQYVQSESNDAVIAARIDRLPNSAMHRRIILILALAIFFDTVDLNSFASAAPALIHNWGMTINQIAYITSASFIGMFFGATIGGWLSDRIGRKSALMTFVRQFQMVRPPRWRCRLAVVSHGRSGTTA
jgi:hypothetical protein